MLLELLVENYAVIENLRIRFHRGFNVLTGETGSGKSIVVDALGLLFGSRASGDMLRSGAARCRISGIFEPSPAAAEFLASAGIEIEDSELLLEREILAGGKSRSFASSRPVTGKVLRELAPYLGDIHGQHDQQRLFTAEAQLLLLDGFAAQPTLLGEVAHTYAEWRSCAHELAEVEKSAQERLRLLDLWTFQRGEIEAAALKPDEDTELLSERRILQNVGKLMEASQLASAALYDAPESAHSQLRVALKKIEELSRIDDSLATLHDTLLPAQVAIEDATSTLRDYSARLEGDPVRLDEVEARLAAIEKLKRKYGADINGILTFLEQTRAEMESAENSAELKDRLEKRKQALESRFAEQADCLHLARTKAATKLGFRSERTQVLGHGANGISGEG
ncbi:MAG: AAA family ATPase [Bryobacteraceae bacterium]